MFSRTDQFNLNMVSVKQYDAYIRLSYLHQTALLLHERALTSRDETGMLGAQFASNGCSSVFLPFKTFRFSVQMASIYSLISLLFSLKQKSLHVRTEI